MEIKGIVNIGIENIYPHPQNPRKDLGDLTELAESVKKNGVMQNLTVIPGHYQSDGEWMEEGYTLIIGHRRHGAAKLAGITELPCRIVEGMSEKEQLSTMLEENMQRADLTIYEQAQGFQMMLDLGETEDSIAEKTGFSKTTIRRRLNIAKLDPEVLKEKEQEDGFQMTLTDLYALEKVEDVETRNKILGDARDSRDLAARALRAAEEAEKAKKKARIIELLEAKGITEAPEKYASERYSNKWNTVKQIPYSEEKPEEIELEEETEPLYYYTYWAGIEVVKKVKQEKKEKTPGELKQEQRDKNNKAIKAIIAKIDANRDAFVRNIVTGKIESISNKEVPEVKDAIWNVLLSIGTGIYSYNLKNFFAGKEDYKCTDEEKEEAQKQVDSCSVLHQMLIMMHRAMTGLETVDYYGKYKADIAKKMNAAYAIFEKYGWSFEDEEEKQIMDGTHELYEKEEEDA